MIRLVDTHLHLDSEPFEGRHREVVERASQAGVVAMISVGTSASSSRRVLQLAEELSPVYPAIGIQPNDVVDAAEEDWDVIQSLAVENQGKIVALGETGIDCYWDRTPLALQREYFDRHLALADQLGLPVIIHMRESGPEIVEQLRGNWVGRCRGVMHSFTGDMALMEECVALGLHISFAGMVTFKKSGDLREVARRVPGDRILIETDAPYLSPEPLRGRRPNEPARVVHTAECLAKVREVSLEEFAELTTKNACELFGISRP